MKARRSKRRAKLHCGKQQAPAATSANALKRAAASEPNEKLRATAVSLVLLGFVLAPACQNWLESPQDSFPFSYYPMFSKRRGETVMVSHLVGFDSEGRPSTIPYRYAGHGGMNQIRKQIRKCVKRGAADELCANVARRLARKSKYQHVMKIAVVTGRYRLEWYDGNSELPAVFQIDAIRDVPRAPVAATRSVRKGDSS